jgi:hypothetical protein
LDARYLDAATRHGAALQHAYAITGHVAQGLTFRQTFVLASDQMSREWGYSALSRGREANRLYSVAAAGSGEREEYAPAEPERGDPRQRLAAALERSDAQTLASDTDRWYQLVEQLQGAIAEVDVASRGHGSAIAARRAIESDSPGRLRPRARRQHAEDLARARDAEERASHRLTRAGAREQALRAELVVERRALDVARRDVSAGRPPERVLNRARHAGLGIER